ncbi:MAG: MaoC family dehydratase [Pseudomonadota bacterium]
MIEAPVLLPLVQAGDTCSRSVRFSRDEIATFARLSGDSNPLHHDQQAAQRALHGEIIASGEHTTAVLIGLASSFFSLPDAHGPRELLCLHFNFAFKAPVFAEQAIELSWTVASVEPNQRLGGLLVHLDGKAAVRHANPAVVGRGTLLVKSSQA